MILMLWITPRIYPIFILILFHRGLDHNLAESMFLGPDHLGPVLGQFWHIFDSLCNIENEIISNLARLKGKLS